MKRMRAEFSSWRLCDLTEAASEFWIFWASWEILTIYHHHHSMKYLNIELIRSAWYPIYTKICQTCHCETVACINLKILLICHVVMFPVLGILPDQSYWWIRLQEMVVIINILCKYWDVHTTYKGLHLHVSAWWTHSDFRLLLPRWNCPLLLIASCSIAWLQSATGPPSLYIVSVSSPCLELELKTESAQGCLGGGTGQGHRYLDNIQHIDQSVAL